MLLEAVMLIFFLQIFVHCEAILNGSVTGAVHGAVC